MWRVEQRSTERENKEARRAAHHTTRRHGCAVRPLSEPHRIKRARQGCRAMTGVGTHRENTTMEPTRGREETAKRPTPELGQPQDVTNVCDGHPQGRHKTGRSHKGAPRAESSRSKARSDHESTKSRKCHPGHESRSEEERWPQSIRTDIHTCTHARTHARRHAYIHTYIHTYTHTYMHTLPYLTLPYLTLHYIHAYIHTYAHAHMRTCARAHVTLCPPMGSRKDVSSRRVPQASGRQDSPIPNEADAVHRVAGGCHGPSLFHE